MPAGRGGGSGVASGGGGLTSMSSADTGCKLIGTAVNIASHAARLQLRRMPRIGTEDRPMLASVIVLTNFVSPEQPVQSLASKSDAANPSWTSHLVA
jgi:hypothetical protein